MPENTLSVWASCAGDPHTEVKGQTHTWRIDEPVVFGGRNAAPSPVEMLLGSLAGCVCASGNILANEMGVRLSGMQVHVDGDIDSERFLGTSTEGRVGFRNISVRVNADANWTPEQKTAWMRGLSERCPVIDNLVSPTALDIQFT